MNTQHALLLDSRGRKVGYVDRRRQELVIFRRDVDLRFKVADLADPPTSALVAVTHQIAPRERVGG
jgi:hypothetical protein